MHWKARSPLWLMLSVIAHNLVQDFLADETALRHDSNVENTGAVFKLTWPAHTSTLPLTFKKTLCVLVCAAHTFNFTFAF